MSTSICIVQRGRIMSLIAPYQSLVHGSLYPLRDGATFKDRFIFRIEIFFTHSALRSFTASVHAVNTQWSKSCAQKWLYTMTFDVFGCHGNVNYACKALDPGTVDLYTMLCYILLHSFADTNDANDAQMSHVSLYCICITYLFTLILMLLLLFCIVSV